MFSLPRVGYRTFCFLHEACQTRPKSKTELLSPLSGGCTEIGQRRTAQARSNCRGGAITFRAKMRLDECAAVRLTGAHGQIGSEEEAVRRRRRRIGARAAAQRGDASV